MTILYASLAAMNSAAWIPIFPYLRDHPELVEPGSEAALFHAQRARPWIGVGIDAGAALVATMSAVGALVLWTFSLIFLAATSEGLESISRLRRRRLPSQQEERVS